MRRRSAPATARGVGAAVVVVVVVCGFGAPARAQSATLFGEPLGGLDKALHVGASAAITVAGYGAATAVVDEPWQRAAIAASLGATAGLAKEGVDLLGYGTPSLVDLCYDAIGIAFGVGYALALDALVARSSTGAAVE